MAALVEVPTGVWKTFPIVGGGRVETITFLYNGGRGDSCLFVYIHLFGREGDLFYLFMRLL